MAFGKEILSSHVLVPVMKLNSLVLLLSAPVLFAANPALPNFSEKLLERPQLFLSGVGKPGLLPYRTEADAATEVVQRASTGQKRFVSRMPIIEPGAEVDRNMPVAAPRVDIDFKMLVKEPSVESVK